MDRKISKILLYVLILLTILSVTATYYRYVVVRDYIAIDDTEEGEEEGSEEGEE